MADVNVNQELLTEMVQAGIVYGHKKSKTHPRMRPYIDGTRNEIELIDPEATISSLEKTTVALRGVLARGGLILFVGTNPAAKEAIKECASEFKMPYVTNRWLGGTLTNFKVISARMKYYEDLKVKKEGGELSKYTKKEQLQFQKEIGKLSRNFDGLTSLVKLPDLVFIVDINAHKTALNEARALQIPVAAVVDTDDDPASVTYPIFASDHGRKSIEWVLKRLKTIPKNEQRPNPKT